METKGRKINQTAVDNFLGSMEMSLDRWTHFLNMRADARMYKWNAATVAAIYRGIEKAYNGRACNG